MRRIQQNDEDGCGIACVAMLSGKTYPQVKRECFPHRENLATSTRDLRVALAEYGIETHGGLIPLRTRNYRTLEHDAILKICPRNKGLDWHWVVWDSRRKLILDPLPSTEQYKNIRAISYLRVF